MLYPGIPSPTTPYIQPMYIPMSSPNPRKPPAPGNLPTPTPVTPQPQSQQTYFPPTATADHMAGWNGNNAAAGFMDDAVNNNNNNNINGYGMMPTTTPTQFRPTVATAAPSTTSSTALARRGANNQLVTTNRSFNPQPNDQWPGFGNDSLMTQQNGAPRVDEHDNIEVLEERAQRAKREAQAKRKQIPPFVQKLNSFLEESKNTDLIRWSEKGDSFVVLDEDEFAKTLIPELFKHNNYASFVRQLNMYGFHKKVGLSDNSMKASERKNKSPSEYYNPYFRRGHPNLLWLINKPKGGTSKKKSKRSEDPEVESDEDAAIDEAAAQNFTTAPAPVANRALPAPEAGPLQKKELAVVRDQVQNLQHQHQAIAMQISRLQNEHRQLAGQAKIFQEQHDRHEHSINAILTFLANVFRKPLEEQGVVNNMNDLFAGIIPNLQMPQAQQQGNVVDLSDWDHQQQSMPNSMATPSKRSQRLLMPVPGAAAAQLKRSASASPSYSGPHQPPMGTITELLDPSPDPGPTTPYLKPDLKSNAQEGMMRMMQDVNTNASSKAAGVDLPGLGGSGTTPMTDDQRNRMLSIMTASQGGDGSSPTSGQPDLFGHHATTSLGSSAVPPSFSPMLRSPAQPPSLQAMSRTQAEIEQLQKLQKEQNDQIDHLNSLLKPLSPSGEIPGLVDGYFDDGVENFEPVDFGNFIDPNAFNGEGAAGDFDFGSTNFEGGNFDLLNDSYTANNNYNSVSSAGSRVETETPSSKSHSPAVTEEVLRDDLEDSPGRAAKRQRKG